MKTSNKTLRLAILFMVPIFNAVIANGATSEPKPLFRQDLRSFGYVTEDFRQIVVNYTDLNFLSEDLVLVTINNRLFGPVEKLFSDRPPSKLLLFDVLQTRLLKSAEMRVEKDVGSVKATRDGQFVLLNESGLHLCSRELECGPPLHTGGPLLVSPRGTRIVVGGNGQTERKLLDAATLQELGRFPGSVPG